MTKLASEQRRVVLVCGALPVDSRHLEVAAHEVALIVYRSSWLPPGTPSSASLDGIPTRTFAPLVKARQGHLAYVYQGLWAALDRDRPHVVHVVSEPWGLLAVQVAAWVRRRPSTRLVLHGCDTIWHHGTGPKQLGRRLLLRATLPVVDAWLAENTKALDLAATGGLSAESLRARVHTNPRDSQLFRPPTAAERAEARAARGLEPNRVVIGFLGRLVPEKGVRLFLDAAEQLLADGFPATFLVAGSGPLHDEVDARSSEHVHALGSLRHPDGVVSFLRALDVFACPSLTTPTWEDQGPRVLLEAMMCGCLPVGTPTGAIPEMMSDRGVVARSTDVADVADALRHAALAAVDQQERRLISEWATARFSAEAVAGQLVAVWRQLYCGDVPSRKDRPMRIAVLTHRASYGAFATITRGLAKGMTAAGVEVDVLYLQGPPPEAISAEYPPGVRLFAIGGRSRTCWVKVARYLRANRPACLVSLGWVLNPSAVVAATVAGTRTPVLLNEQSSLSYKTRVEHRHQPRLRVLGALAKKLYPRASVVTGASRAIVDDLENVIGLGARVPLRVVSNSVDGNEVRKLASEPDSGVVRAEPGDPVFVNVARHARQKNLPLLLRAFRTYRKAGNAGRLVLVGDGPDNPQLRALAADLDLDDAVVFRGVLLNPFPQMAAASAFVLSSEEEGFGLVLVEALALGLPVISTDCPGGPSEILQSGRVGVLVPSGNEAALAGAMQRVAAESPRDADGGEVAVQRAADFAPEAVARVWLDVMRDAGVPVASTFGVGQRG